MTAHERVRTLGLVGRIVLVALLLASVPLVAIDLVTFVQYAPYAAAGGVLAIRRPRHVVGWLLIGIGFALLGTTTPPWLDVQGLQTGSASLRDLAYVWFGMWAGGASFLLFAALAMTFPSGHLPTGRWRRPSKIALACGIVVVLIPAFFESLTFSIDGMTTIVVPNPIGLLAMPPPESRPIAEFVVTLLPMAVFAFAVAGLIARYRGAEGVVRLQIRWLVASVASVVITVLAGIIGFVLSGETAEWVWLPVLVAYPTVPLAVGVAVLRYRLFEIDRIVSRTIAYLSVSAVLFAVFAAVTLGIQSFVGSAVGEGTLTVAASTLIVAALFNPLRIRIQRIVDRRFNRSRYDQERTVEAFALGLRDEVDVERVLEAVRRAAERSVEPTASAIWQRDRGEVT
jgi:uncharacterized membrane protein